MCGNRVAVIVEEIFQTTRDAGGTLSFHGSALKSNEPQPSASPRLLSLSLSLSLSRHVAQPKVYPIFRDPISSARSKLVGNRMCICGSMEVETSSNWDNFFVQGQFRGMGRNL